MVSKNEALNRLFRLAAILVTVLTAVSVISLVAAQLLVRLATGESSANVMTVMQVYNILQYLVDYGLEIAIFAVMIVAAKHLPSIKRANLLKIGGILGVVGNALMLVILLESSVNSDPHPAFEGWVSLLEMLSGNPITRVLLPRVTNIAAVLCAACFVFHASPTANLTAILKIACIGLLLLMGLLSMTAGFWALLRYVLGLAANGLSIAMYLSLAKYYKDNTPTA